MDNSDEHTRSPSSEPSPRDSLPPVEAPSARFLLQLFVIPMVIVTIIVLVWLMFSWLAHMGSNPQQLVRDLKNLNEASWQKALTLADLLRNPEYDHLKRDPQVASDLAGVLDSQLDEASMGQESIKLRMFLCRALGEFQVPEVLPTLSRAAVEEREPEEIAVRRTALEALAIFAQNNPSLELHSDEQLLEILFQASRERSQRSGQKEPRAELRSTAAYVLGVIGGPEALDRLELLMDDAYANTRYNAALGLARHGDARAQRVLLEMLDPANEEAAQTEEHEAGKASKRLLVIKNGIQGAKQLAEENTTDDLDQLSDALRGILQSDLELFDRRVHRGIRVHTEDALLAFNRRSV